MAQEMVNRSPGHTEYSYTADSNTAFRNRNRVERQNTSCSEIELTAYKAEFGERIVKTTEWEASIDTQPHVGPHGDSLSLDSQARHAGSAKS